LTRPYLVGFEATRDTGMRLTVPGSEAVLKLQAVYLNGDWDPFWQFQMRQEGHRRFGQRRRSPLPRPTTL